MSQLQPQSQRAALKKSLIRAYEVGIHTFRLRAFFQNLRSQIDTIAIQTLKDQELQLIKHQPQWRQLKPEEQQAALTEVHRLHIQSLPLYPLYQALVEDESEGALEILGALSTEQFQHIIDLDMWEQGELRIKDVMQWLRRCADISSRELYERFTSLDHEHQLSIIGTLVLGYSPEEAAELAETKQNSLLSFPGGAYFYALRSTDDKLMTITIDLMEALQEHHMEYALSLISHSSWLPAAESQQMALQFSQARCEDLGFIPQLRAQQSFVFSSSQAADDFHAKVRQLVVDAGRAAGLAARAGATSLLSEPTTSVDVADMPTPAPFLLTVLQYLDAQQMWQHQDYRNLMDDWLMCANHLASATGLHPSQTTDRDFLFEHMLAAQSLALDLLSSNHPAIASTLLSQLPCKSLMQYVHSVLQPIRCAVAAVLIELRVVASGFEFFVDSSRFGLAQNALDECLDFYGFLHTELLKGLFNRFPLLVEKPLQSTLYRQQSPAGKRKQPPPLYHIPLHTTVAFKQLIAEVVAVLWATQLVQPDNPSSSGLLLASHQRRASLDSLWLRSLANALMGHSFIPRRFEPGVLAEFTALDPQLMGTRFASFARQMKSVATSEPLMALIHLASTPHQHQELTSFPSALVIMVDHRIRNMMDEYFQWLLEIQSSPDTHHLLLPQLAAQPGHVPPPRPPA